MANTRKQRTNPNVTNQLDNPFIEMANLYTEMERVWTRCAERFIQFGNAIHSVVASHPTVATRTATQTSGNTIKERALNYLMANGAATTSEIARALGLKTSSVAPVVSQVHKTKAIARDDNGKWHYAGTPLGNYPIVNGRVEARA